MSVPSVVLWYHREATEETTSDRNERSENITESHLLGWLFFVSEYQGKEGEVMANNENLKPVRTKSEARERGRAGGKASGEARRRRADFRKTLNALLTAEIDSPEWSPLLESLGLDPTLEAAINMAMIKEALTGNVKAYEAVARYAGQSGQTAADDEEQRIRTDRAKRARDQEVGDTDNQDDNIQSFLKAMRPTEGDLAGLFEEDEADAEAEEETGEV